jgi:hypothetical protein
MLGIAVIGWSGLCIWHLGGLGSARLFAAVLRPDGDGLCRAECLLAARQMRRLLYSKEEATTSTGNTSLYFSRHRRAVTG